MDESIEVERIYAEAAPLPATIVDHAMQRLSRAWKLPRTDKRFIDRFLQILREKRRAAFGVLDPYVRAGELSRAWMLDKIAKYGKPVSETTFTEWQHKHLIEMERTGKIKPRSAQSVLMMRMMDRGQRGYLPPGGVPVEDSWFCYVQRSPTAPREVWPVRHLHQLPRATFCWTPNAGSYWEEEGWHLIGEDEGFSGCVRFSGTHRVRGHIWYNVDIEEVRQWDAAVADLYQPFPGDTLGSLQVLCYPLFHRLAQSRLLR